MIKEYMIRPPTFKAIQYTGNNVDELKAFVGDKLVCNIDNPTQFSIIPVSGYCTNISEGDYILKRKDGFCIFEEKYFNEFFMEVRSI